MGYLHGQAVQTICLPMQEARNTEQWYRINQLLHILILEVLGAY